jgi:hypothetical protein
VCRVWGGPEAGLHYTQFQSDETQITYTSDNSSAGISSQSWGESINFQPWDICMSADMSRKNRFRVMNTRMQSEGKTRDTVAAHYWGRDRGWIEDINKKTCKVEKRQVWVGSRGRKTHSLAFLCPARKPILTSTT